MYSVSHQIAIIVPKMLFMKYQPKFLSLSQFKKRRDSLASFLLEMSDCSCFLKILDYICTKKPVDYNVLRNNS